MILANRNMSVRNRGKTSAYRPFYLRNGMFCPEALSVAPKIGFGDGDTIRRSRPGRGNTVPMIGRICRVKLRMTIFEASTTLSHMIICGPDV